MLFPITLVLFISPAAAPEDGTNRRVSVSTCTATSCSAFVQACAMMYSSASIPSVCTVNFSAISDPSALEMLHIRASEVFHIDFGEVVAVIMRQRHSLVIGDKLALYKKGRAAVSID